MRAGGGRCGSSLRATHWWSRGKYCRGDAGPVLPNPLFCGGLYSILQLNLLFKYWTQQFS